jgi:ribonuclease E
VGYPADADAGEHVSPEATGFPAPSEAAESTTAIGTEPPEVVAEAAQNGSKTTRRRRSSRSRNKTATEGDTTEPSELVTSGS